MIEDNIKVGDLLWGAASRHGRRDEQKLRSFKVIRIGRIYLYAGESERYEIQIFRDSLKENSSYGSTRKFYRSKEEWDDNAYRNANRHKISELVSGLDVKQLRAVATLLGYAPDE